MMFNPRRRSSHSSRVQLPLVNMSASWCLGVNMFDWILGSKLIRSNNQSSATLWVLDTCLIVGLLPFDDRLDHCFGVFKNVQLGLTLRRICDCGDVVHMRQLILYSSTNVTLLSPRLLQARAGSPSIPKPTSNETISDSVQL